MSKAYNKEVFELLEFHSVDAAKGLSDQEVDARLSKYGFNQFRKQKKHSAWLILITQFKNAITVLLLAASLISFLFEDYTEAVAIIAVLLINAIIGFILEIQAIRSMEALRKLDLVFAQVIRNGTKREIESKYLVPGDLLALEAGELITADARLISNAGLEVNESILTGESIPVAKIIDPLAGEIMLADRINMVFKGTAVTNGNAVALVTETGANTAVGEISEMVDQADKDEVPLNKKLNHFSRKLIWLTVVLVIPFIVVALIQQKDIYLMVEISIALAVAAIPEGLPIVATISLARGMLGLAKHKVIVKKLAAVETLGETNIIMTDKTGTLTQNSLKADTVCVTSEIGSARCISSDSVSKEEEEFALDILIRISVLSNNASIDHAERALGDPIEAALLYLASDYDEGTVERLRNSWIEVDETPFDSETRVMANLHKNSDQYQVSAKGATVEILDKCNRIYQSGDVKPFEEEEKLIWKTQTDQLSAKGLKVLAFAFNNLNEQKDAYATDLIFAGLIGFQDPPRQEVSQSILECRQAGIKVVMVTGDHPETAKAIARQIKLSDNPREKVVHGKDFASMLSNNQIEDTILFCRVSPRQKLELVEYYQNQGWIVGMTGDGVNDAPALRKADIGVAMGLRGTQVAEEASDMVLLDDSFSSIIRAIRQGRIIFNNIKNFVIYLLSCNLSEIMVVAVAAFSNLTLPLLPLQILFLNLVTDVFPALALGMGKGDASIMTANPRDPKEPILHRKNWMSIIGYSIALTASVLGVFLYALLYRNYDPVTCNNIAFFTLAFAQLLHPLNLIELGEKFFSNSIIRNPHLWSAVAFCTIILLGAYFSDSISQLLNLTTLLSEQWYLIAVGSIAPLVIVRVMKLARIIL
ncbi:MAG: cation-translocating P-type ATPase [Cyclobacteriaceae bacterium]